MDAPRKRTKLTHEAAIPTKRKDDTDGESTDFKLAVLASLHPDRTQEVLLDYLLAYDGSVEAVSKALSASSKGDSSQKRSAVIGYQSSLSSYATANNTITTAISGASPTKVTKPLTKKGKTLHLYDPKEIETNCPCSIIHNFLPQDEVDALLQELLSELPTFRRDKFVLFDREVQSPHTVRFYVNSVDEVETQKTEYIYNGGEVPDVGQTPPQMLRISKRVEEAVNGEIERRKRDFFPDGKKLKFQSPDEWKPNASFVNCYDGAKESVGWHSDQLTYLGPRATIGSISIGVAREFRIRRIVPQIDDSSADEQGQIAIHLPHNSLLVMHADMQEEWKHSIAPAQVIDPHPVALNKRFCITYRWYQDYLHPKLTPRCKCNVSCVLRCVQRRQATRGRYMWQCHAGYVPGRTGCSYFEWAEFDHDGRPPWADGYVRNLNGPQASVGDVSTT